MLTDDIQTYLAELAIKKAERTVVSYGCGLRLYVNLFSEITPENVVGFAAWLHEHKARATQDLYLVAVSRFARWMKGQGKMGADEYMKLLDRLDDVRGGRRAQSLPKIPKETDVVLLVGAASGAYSTKDTKRNQLMELRDIAMIHALRSTGCRVSEVADLRRDDLRERAAIVTGKGDKQRMVYFDDTAWQAITMYLAARDATGVGGLAGEPVFCRYDKKSWGKVLPIATNVIRYVINKLEKNNTIEHIWPHRLRHRFATRVLQQTHDLALTQDLMGHVSPTTTRNYAQLDDEYRQQEYQKVSL